MRRVCMVRAYYDNPETLRCHLNDWRLLPDDVRLCLSAIFSDDCSPEYPAQLILQAQAPLPVPVRLFRIDEDVRWNWLAARNVAMWHSTEKWHLITDMDHFVPEATLRALVSGQFNPRRVYRFSRREHTGEAIPPHPNSWFMTRDMFWHIGGFNEAASGYYGTDGHYRRRVALTAPVEVLDLELIRREHQGDSSTTYYLRKQPEDAAGKRILREWGDNPPRVLSYPYHEVSLDGQQVLEQDERHDAAEGP